MSLRSSVSNTSSTQEENCEIHEHVIELHLALKYYFNSSEQQHILYLLKSYYNNGNLNYLCLRLRPILDTLMKRSLLRYLVSLVPKQHIEHYHKLVADLYNGLKMEQIPQPEVPLRQMTSLKLDSGGHAFADLQDALGLSDDYVRYYEQMLNEVPSQHQNLSRQQSHKHSNSGLYLPETPGNLKPTRYTSIHDVSAGSHPLNGHDYPDNSNDTRGDDQQQFFGAVAPPQPAPSYVQMVEHQIEVTCKKKFNASYGFKLKGGSEVAEPIRIGEVVRGSEAEKAGLKVEDRIISVNGTSFDNITSTGAIKAIRANKKLKMLIGRLLAETVASAPIQPPSSDGNHQNHQIANNNNMASLNMTVPNSTPSSFLIETSLNNQRNDVFESSEPPSPVSPSDLIWINERGEHVVNPAQMPGYGEVSKVHIVLPQARSPLGIRIRGGSEYGIGIFITNVEPSSYASRHGLKIGDQILAVNNEDLSQATHRKAIEMISEDKILVMSVRHTGCIPDVSPSSKLLPPSSVSTSQSRHFTHLPLPESHPNTKYQHSQFPDDFTMTKSPQRSVASSDHSSERKSFLSTELPSAIRTDSPSNSGSSFGRGNTELEEREMLDRNFDSRNSQEQHTLVREKTISRRSAEEHHSGTLPSGVSPNTRNQSETRFNQIRGRYSPNPNKQSTHVDRNRTLRSNNQKESPPSAVSEGDLNIAYVTPRRSPGVASSAATSRYLDTSRSRQEATCRSNSISRNLPIPLMTDEDFMDEKLPNKNSKKVRIEKVVKTLGIAIEGGADTSLQLPRIIRIKAESCASYSGQLSVGMKLLEVNDKPLYGLTHVECGKKIAESFQSSYRNYIDFLVEEETNPGT